MTTASNCRETRTHAPHETWRLGSETAQRVPTDDCPGVRQPIVCPSWCAVVEHHEGERGGRLVVHAVKLGRAELLQTVDPYGTFATGDVDLKIASAVRGATDVLAVADDLRRLAELL